MYPRVWKPLTYIRIASFLPSKCSINFHSHQHFLNSITCSSPCFAYPTYTNTHIHGVAPKACQHTIGGIQDLPSLASGLYLRVIALCIQITRGTEEQVALREAAGRRCSGWKSNLSPHSGPYFTPEKKSQFQSWEVVAVVWGVDGKPSSALKSIAFWFSAAIGYFQM